MDSQTLGSVASSSKLARIKEIGFVPAGCWRLEAGDLSFKLDPPLAGKRNVLYAFVVDGDVKYIGKTVVTLKQRVTGYKNPASSQTTNVRNNEQLRNALTHVTQVEIFALPDNGLLHYGRFHVNLAAGLEDSLIRDLQPPWNGGKKETGEGKLVPPETP